MPNAPTQLTVAIEELILLALYEDPEHELTDEQGNMRLAILKLLGLRPSQRTKDQVSFALKRLDAEGRIIRERPTCSMTTRVALNKPLTDGEVEQFRRNKQTNVAQFSS